MCSKCRKKKEIVAPAPYRASPRINGNTGGRYAKADLHPQATSDKIPDFIQALLGWDETDRLIKQAYYDIKTNNLSTEV